MSVNLCSHINYLSTAKILVLTDVFYVIEQNIKVCSACDLISAVRNTLTLRRGSLKCKKMQTHFWMLTGVELEWEWDKNAALTEI